MKTIIILFALSYTLPATPFDLEQERRSSHLIIEEGNLKQEAFKILQAKCNVCHRSKNPGKVFTLANMNSLSAKINKQVFIKKRMPKGRDIQLSQGEYDQLKKWLHTQDIN